MKGAGEAWLGLPGTDGDVSRLLPAELARPYNRSEGARHRNGLFHSCACGRVAGVVWLLGSGWATRVCRRRAAAPPLAMGGRGFSKYVSGDGAYTDVFS